MMMMTMMMMMMAMLNAMLMIFKSMVMSVSMMMMVMINDDYDDDEHINSIEIDRCSNCLQFAPHFLHSAQSNMIVDVHLIRHAAIVAAHTTTMPVIVL
jgi:hypothetical protein